MKFEPMNPAPPVTRIFTRILLCPFRVTTRPMQELFRNLPIARRSTASGDLICSGFGNKIGSLQQGVKGSGIGPPTIEDAMSERALLKVHIIHIRDFQSIPQT